MSNAHKRRRAKTTKKSSQRTNKAKRSVKSARSTKVIKAGKKAALNKLNISGALEWLLPMMETAYTPLVPRGSAEPGSRPMAMSSLRQESAAVLAPAAPTVWRDTLLEYKRRKAVAVAAARARPLGAPAAPFVPGARNWLPLGPSVVLNGQTVGSQPIAGRVAGLAIAPGGSVVYVASANGGVFRSQDGGTTWRSLMDRFDLDPNNFARASLA